MVSDARASVHWAHAADWPIFSGQPKAVNETNRGGYSSTGGASRNRTDVHGFAGRCITTLPSRRWKSSQVNRLKSKREARISFPLKCWSGRRVSNSRPQPWQGCALPTELLPHHSLEIICNCMINDCTERNHSRFHSEVKIQRLLRSRAIRTHHEGEAKPVAGNTPSTTR